MDVRVDEAGQQGGAPQVDPRQVFRKLSGGPNRFDAAAAHHYGLAVGSGVGYSVPYAVRDECVTLWRLRSGRCLVGHGCLGSVRDGGERLVTRAVYTTGLGGRVNAGPGRAP